MKKLTLFFLAVTLATTTANADDYYFCFTRDFPPTIYFAEIPGPGTYDGFDIVHSFPIVDDREALTYDGEHWWIPYQAEIYCFDNNGDYVSSFPRPYPWSVPGLGWDGEYLWVDCHYVWQLDIYGNLGPYGYFPAVGVGHDSLTVNPDAERIIMGNCTVEEGDLVFLRVFDYYGNYLYRTETIGGSGYQDSAGLGGLAYHDGIVWVTYNYWSYYSNESIRETYGYEYVEGGGWNRITTIENATSWNLSICNENFVNIAETSFGKIKAYFAEKEGDGE